MIGKLTPGGVPGGGIQQRREDDKKDSVGIERDLGDPGNQAQQGAGDHQHNGIRNIEAARQLSKDYDEQQQQQENQLHSLDIAFYHS